MKPVVERELRKHFSQQSIEEFENFVAQSRLNTGKRISESNINRIRLAALAQVRCPRSPDYKRRALERVDSCYPLQTHVFKEILGQLRESAGFELPDTLSEGKLLAELLWPLIEKPHEITFSLEAALTVPYVSTPPAEKAVLYFCESSGTPIEKGRNDFSTVCYCVLEELHDERAGDREKIKAFRHKLIDTWENTMDRRFPPK